MEMLNRRSGYSLGRQHLSWLDFLLTKNWTHFKFIFEFVLIVLSDNHIFVGFARVSLVLLYFPLPFHHGQPPPPPPCSKQRPPSTNMCKHNGLRMGRVSITLVGTVNGQLCGDQVGDLGWCHYGLTKLRGGRMYVWGIRTSGRLRAASVSIASFQGWIW